MSTQQDDLFNSLFEHRDQRIDRLGNPLVELDANIDWEAFRPLLEWVRLKTRKSSAGRKPWDVILMFKSLVLASFYNLSDEQLEFQIEDRRSFQRFIGLLDAKHAPDRNSFWLLRESLKDLKLTETLFNEFNHQLALASLIVRKGQLVDVSLVKAPVQRNTPDENARIKAGEAIDGWSENKRRQKDIDARWTKKGDKPYYGYKNHVNVDNAHKLIRKYTVTPTPAFIIPNDWIIYWTTAVPAVPFGLTRLSLRSRRSALKTQGYRSQIRRKGARGKALTPREKTRQQDALPNPLPGRAWRSGVARRYAASVWPAPKCASAS